MKTCPQCHRAGSSLGACGSKITCPPRDTDVEVRTGGLDVVLQCTACDITFVMPSAHLANNIPLSGQMRVCQRGVEVCQARAVILSGAKKGKATDASQEDAPTQ